MRFYVLVAIAEAAIIAGSGIDARWRPAAERRLWLARWVWWHIAPAWLLWLLFIKALIKQAESCAQRSCERYEAARASAPPLVLADEVPYVVTDVTECREREATPH